ncbi:hypothetical protein lerEdw1_004714 [Lerista edwardsae]|nr:hypothetical protein lerEdw1_004714 [Lerista edwardsae]
MTVTAVSGSWCPPSRPTSGSAKWRSCSMSSTTSSTCSWPSRRTRLSSGSSNRPRCTRRATLQGLPGPRSRRSTPTRLVLLISKGTVFCVAELHFQGVQQADPEPEKQKERHVREGGEEKKKEISATGQKEKNIY